MTQWFAGTPRRMVQGGLTLFFAGGVAMLAGLLARLGEIDPDGGLALLYPDLPTWFVPESPAGYTAAAMMVCWGVWAMGSGLQLARATARSRR